MTPLRNLVSVFCFCLLFGFPIATWSQSESAEKNQALQQQLDQMKAQMQNLQAQILELSNASKPPGAAPIPGPPPTQTTITATATTPPQEEGGAAQAAALGVVPPRQVGQTTATRQTDAQDPIAAPRLDNAPLDPRYPG